MEFSKYCKIKNNYCICYFGSADEYLLQLKFLKPIIEQYYKGIKIFIGCIDEKISIIEKFDEKFKMSEFKLKRYDFSHIKEIKFNGRNHPIEEFLEKSEIKQFVVCNKLNEEYSTKCVIVTKGNYPTNSLENYKIDKLKKIARQNGFDPVLDESINDAGLVMGVESYNLFLAASKGIKTTLVPTGLGTRLYKNMFPLGDIMNI